MQTTQQLLETNTQARNALSNILSNDLSEEEYQSCIITIHNHLINMDSLIPQQQQREELMKEMVGVLNKISELYHYDRTCSLEAQGYTEMECEQIGLDDYAATIAKKVLTKYNNLNKY